MDQQNARPTPSQGGPAAPDQPTDGSSSAPVGFNRRALLRGGAAASPILLTLASGPVAATGNCVVASSFVSASVYKSRSPGTNNISCVPGKTAQQLCTDAVQTPWKWPNGADGCNVIAPHNKNLSVYCGSGVICGTAYTSASRCHDVLKHGTAGMQSSGEVAILQRLIALGHGAPTVFTQAYCNQVWNARNNAANMASLVNDGGTTPWDQARLLAWLDYSANGFALP